MIVLHHCAQSRSMRTLWLLHELGVAFESVTHPFGKALRAPEFLKVSPAGRVPALELDPERADWLKWVHFAETISQHAAALTQQHIMLYEDAMRSAVVMKLEAARLGKCYEALEGHLQAAGSDYLLASGFSAADVSVGQALYISAHFRKLDAHPAMQAWYARLTQRAAFQRALPQPGEPCIYTQDFYPPWESL